MIKCGRAGYSYCPISCTYAFLVVSVGLPWWNSCRFSWVCTTTTDQFSWRRWSPAPFLLALPQRSMSLSVSGFYFHQVCHSYRSLLSDSNLLLQPSCLYLFPFLSWYLLSPSLSLCHVSYLRCAACPSPTNPLRKPHSISAYNSVWPA